MEFLILYVPSLLFFGTLAIFFSRREELTKRELNKQRKELSRKLYEVSVLNSVSEKIGYSLNIQSVAQAIVYSVENLYDLSTVSYALIKGNTIELQTVKKELVGKPFLEGARDKVLQSLFALDEKAQVFPLHELPVTDTERNTSIKNDSLLNNKSYFDTIPESYFNIPLVIHNKVIGVITIASRKKNIYQDEDMSVLYKLVNQAEQAIERLEEVIGTEKGKLDSLIVSLSSGTILFLFEDEKFSLSTINQAACDFLKLSPSPTLDEVIQGFSGIENFVEQVKSVITERKTVIVKEVKIGTNYLNLYVSPVFVYEKAQIIGVSITMQSVTFEKQAEQMRENFIHMVVHELRSPLTSIHGASALLLSEKLTPTERTKMLHLIKDASSDMNKDIADLLDAAKIDAGKFGVVKTLSDVGRVIQEKVDLVSVSATVKHIHIAEKLANLPQFEFDPTRIGQVITNILSNSIKFTPEGGRIQIKSEQEGAFLRISITDNGVGIADNKKALLFSKFGQILDLQSAKGSGLGLYISKAIIESHGGNIWVDSDEGRGTTVSFTIPFVGVQEESKTDRVLSDEHLMVN